MCKKCLVEQAVAACMYYRIVTSCKLFIKFHRKRSGVAQPDLRRRHPRFCEPVACRATAGMALPARPYDSLYGEHTNETPPFRPSITGTCRSCESWMTCACMQMSRTRCLALGTTIVNRQYPEGSCCKRQRTFPTCFPSCSTTQQRPTSEFHS